MTKQPPPSIQSQIIHCVMELARERMHVPDLKARLHPADYTELTKQMYELVQHVVHSPGGDIKLHTSVGAIEVCMDPTLEPGEFKIISNRNDGMLNVLDCRLDRGETETDGDFAMMFQQFAADKEGPAILESRIVYKTPMGTELTRLVQRIEKIDLKTLSHWERDFLHSVSVRLVEDKRRPTEKQMYELAKIFKAKGV